MTTPDGKIVPGVQYEDGWVIVRRVRGHDTIDGWWPTRRKARMFANSRQVRKARRIICWDYQ